MAEPREPIGPADELLRWLAPRGHVHEDGTVLSNAYKRNGKPDPDISVDLGRLTTPAETVARALQPGSGVGIVQAAVPLQAGLEVIHTPLPENYAHSSIRGATRQHCRLLAEATRVVIPPRPTIDPA